MLEEKSVISQITVLEDDQLQVQRADLVLKDGVEIARKFHRHVVAPGDDLTREDPHVSKVGKAVHTAAVVTAYRRAHPAAV
jgi:urease accessory protein UreE